MSISTQGFWQPQIGTTWQWQLDANVNTSVNAMVFDIDASNSQGDITGSSIVSAVKAGYSNRRVICYVNVGSLETDGSRSDQNKFLPSDVGGQYPGWPKERFLDIRSQNVRNLMQARFQAMKASGCDAIEPDNMALDYQGKDGFTPPISQQDGIEYINWFTGAVHTLGMAIGAKNGGAFFAKNPELVLLFEFVVVEECTASPTNPCSLYDTFIRQGKPVFAADYTDSGNTRGCTPITGSVANACATLNAHNFDGIIKNCDLDVKVTQCRAFDGSAPGTAVTKSSDSRVVGQSLVSIVGLFLFGL
ncbi:UNVERIFIED_CONTAM: hypothetical protein HDU68_003594 [Siphonaria sp. JEL0065]|nr:hypothetical protein HDU68_003594 [Siphonaria sp. JEL0065]